MKNLTIGKKQGLEKITTKDGKFKVLALDQNNSFRKFLQAWLDKTNQNRKPTDQEITDAKLQITKTLSPEATAVLLDGQYGLEQAIKADAVFPECSLIGRLEKSVSAGEKAQIETKWSVTRIKEIGCQAVKVLLFMDVADEAFTTDQIKFIKQVQQQCKDEDILLMIEELSFPKKEESLQSDEYKTRKQQNILDSARLLEEYADILKLEYPGDKNLQILRDSITKPWVLLSAGQDYEVFKSQLQQAMKFGCGGFMAGRGIFKEYFTMDEEEREQFLSKTAIERMKELGEIVDYA